jgi:hypothetical protein
MHMPPIGDDARRHYKTGRGYRLTMQIGDIGLTLRASSESALQAVALDALDRIAADHWSSKSEIVPMAQALGVAVTSSNTVAEIKAAIAAEAANV